MTNRADNLPEKVFSFIEMNICGLFVIISPNNG